MSKSIRFSSVILAGALILLASGCGSSSEQKASTGSNKSSAKTIGFSVYDYKHDFFKDMEKGTKEGVEGLGYTYTFHDEKSSEEAMVAGANELINKGVAALIISPFKPDALGPIVDAAHAKKIPVIVDDIGGGNSNYDAIVISDNKKGGNMAADFAVKQLGSKSGSKEVAIIKAEPSAVYANRRGEGFKEVITAGGFTVVSEKSAHSEKEECYNIMKELLVSNPKLQVVFTENDPMALGAVQACEEAKRSDILIIGFNGDKDALDAIKAGKMAATVQQVPFEMGKMTANLADQLIKGEKLKFSEETKREIYVPVKLITKDNVK